MSISYWTLLKWLVSYKDQAPRFIALIKQWMEATDLADRVAVLGSLCQLIEQLLRDNPIAVGDMRFVGTSDELDAMAAELNALGLNSEYREVIRKVFSEAMALRQE